VLRCCWELLLQAPTRGSNYGIGQNFILAGSLLASSLAKRLAPAPERPDVSMSSPLIGISKSNSTASASGRSTKSYDSIKVLGAFALGSLRVVCHDDPPRMSSGDDGDGGPPPLDPPESAPKPKRQSHSRSPKNVMAHSLGGGDVVVVLQMPKDYIVGYDALAFTATDFAGVRGLPPGAHFFWAANSENTSSRSGFWVMSSGVDRVHVIQWHKYNEVFVQPTRTETRIQAENVDEIFPDLPLYRDPTATSALRGQLAWSKIEANQHMWEQLSSSITQSVLDRLTAEQDGAWNVHTGDRVYGAVRHPSELDLDRRLKHPVFQSHEIKFCFRQQDRTYDVSTLGRDRTVNATDTTSYVLAAIDGSRHNLTEEDVVGEYQFAYIVGMYLGNDACIQQWWHTTLALFLRAYRLAIRRPKLVAGVFRTLSAQLAHSSSWLETSILDMNEPNTRDLRIALIIYKRRLNELLEAMDKERITPAHIDVGNAFARVQAFVTTDLGWDIDGHYLRVGKLNLEDGEEIELGMDELQEEDERGEWAPEIVELDEEGRQIGLVSWSD